MKIPSLWSKSILQFPAPSRAVVSILCGFQVLIGGLRFSDGRVLLGLASDQGINAPIFQNEIVQYNWESPLKVFLLRQVPESLFFIAFLFLLLALLPLFGIAAPLSSRFYRFTASLILFTPAIKVSLQNIGVGDGFVLLLSVLCVTFIFRPLLLFVLLVFIGFWHPGQIIFIAGSTFLASFVHAKSIDTLSMRRPRWLAISSSCILSVLASRVLLEIHNSNLGFDYVDRFEFIKQELWPFIAANLAYLPIALVYPAIAVGAVLSLTSFFAQSRLGGPLKIACATWILIVFSASYLTTDPSRVFTLCLSPMLVVIGDAMLNRARKISSATEFETLPGSRQAWRFVMYIPALIVLLPLPGWSGINISVWGDLINDLCKYGLACFGS